MDDWDYTSILFFLYSVACFYQFRIFFFLFPNKLHPFLYQVLTSDISFCPPGKSTSLDNIILMKIRIFGPPVMEQHLHSWCINLKIEIFWVPLNFCSCTYFRLEGVSFCNRMYWFLSTERKNRNTLRVKQPSKIRG